MLWSAVALTTSSYTSPSIYGPPFLQNVVLHTAPNPEGAWSACFTAFVALAADLRQLPEGHARPEYGANGGQILYVTYSRPTATFPLSCARSLSNSIAPTISRVGSVPKQSTIGFRTLLDCLIDRE